MLEPPSVRPGNRNRFAMGPSGWLKFGEDPRRPAFKTVVKPEVLVSFSRAESAAPSRALLPEDCRCLEGPVWLHAGSGRALGRAHVAKRELKGRCYPANDGVLAVYRGSVRSEKNGDYQCALQFWRRELSSDWFRPPWPCQWLPSLTCRSQFKFMDATTTTLMT